MAKATARPLFDARPDVAVEARLDAEAEADYAAGRAGPHEQVGEWLEILAKNE